MVSYAGGLALTLRHKRASSFGYVVSSPARRLQLNFRLLWEWEKQVCGVLGSSFTSYFNNPNIPKQNTASPDLAFNFPHFLQNKDNGSLRVITHMSFQGYFMRNPSHRLPLPDFPFPVGQMGTKGTCGDGLMQQPRLGTLGPRQFLTTPNKVPECSSCSSPKKKSS